MTATTMFFHTTDSNEPVQPPQACLQKAKYLLQEEADWRLHAMPEEAQYTRIQAHLKPIFFQHYKFLAIVSWRVTLGEPSEVRGNERKNKPCIYMSLSLSISFFFYLKKA